MLHIADTKMARRYGDFFIRQIHKLEEVYYITCTSIIILCGHHRVLIQLFPFAAMFKRLIETNITNLS